MNKMIELAEKEIVRNYILTIAEQCIEEGASSKLIKSIIAKNGIELTEEQLAREIKYLENKSLIEVKRIENKVLNIKRDIIRITSSGMDVLDGTSTETGIEVGD